MEPRNRFREIDSASLCSQRAGTTSRVGVQARQGWESIPGLLKGFTNTASELKIENGGRESTGRGVL